MTALTDPLKEYGDLLDSTTPPAVHRLVATLDGACRPTTPHRAAHLDAAMARALQARAAGAGQAARSRRAWPVRVPRPRLAALAAALVLVLGSLGGYLRLAAPPPASAQAILRHAAALALAPGQASHATYSIAVNDAGIGGRGDGGANKLGGLTLTTDVWIQAGPDGLPALSAQTLTVSGASGPGRSMGRYIAAGAQTYQYDPAHNAILLVWERRAMPSWALPAEAYDGAAVAQQVATLAQRSPSQVKLLPQQTLDGQPVEVIQVDGWTARPAQRTIFYFDAATYQLRGFDASSNDPAYPTPSWQARLISSATLPAAQVAAGTFTLNAPADARIVAPQPDPAILSGICHSSVNPKDVLESGRQSLLAACQATAPSVTTADLVAALIAPYRAALDAATAAGQITTTQDSAGLAAQQAWLTTWVTTVGTGRGQ